MKFEPTKLLEGTPYAKVDPAILAEAVKNVTERLRSKTFGINRKKNICRRRATGKKGSFQFFCKHYFPHYFPMPFGEQQMELVHLIQSYRSFKNVDGSKNRIPLRSLVALSRGFGKSTILTLCGALWLVLTGTWKFPILVSSTLEQAKEFLRKIQEESEDNAELANDYPELLPKKDIKGQNVSWSDFDLVFNGGFRIIAKGWGNAIRGKRHKNIRPDALLLDDPDEEKDVVSESTMIRKYRWFERAALKLGTVWGIDVILSYTTIAPNCVGEYVFKSDRYKTWIRKKYKALITDQDGTERSSWPEGAPIDLLRIERDEDPVTFAQERQNDPLPEVGQKFKGLVQTWKFERPESFAGWQLALALDLSLGKTERSDFSAIVGLGLSPSGKFYELYSDIQRRLPDQIQKDFIRALQAFPWDIAGIETNGGQEHFLFGFKEHLEDWNELCSLENNELGLTLANKIIVPVVDIDNRGDKDRRIEGTLQVPIATGQLLLREDSTILREQFEEFPYKKKDGPDATQMAYRLIVHELRNSVSFLTAEQRSGAIMLSQKYNQNESNNNYIAKSLDQLRRDQLKRRGF
ncbi:hypothetical protein [Leptospira interrogans]|uniref:hypothetical protein n=1 Tax=Leptospira interrogans TaxID=173 RepID=UPI0003104ED0|nr:hypothetical protein [Leptospira interrogans]UMQ60500.1 hypothetical protein FH585_21500 [Leptospira interrogans]